MRLPSFQTIAALGLLALVGCGTRNTRGRANDATCDLNAPRCSTGLVCNAFAEGNAQCVRPILIRGTVLDIGDASPIAGALVQAVDINGAAVGTSGTTDSSGVFMLVVPAVRDADGNPLKGIYTLRVQAAAYQQFPTAIRPALPLDASTAEASDDGLVIENALTTVGLIALPGDTTSLGSISGIIQAKFNAGLLVVAEDDGTAMTGFSDSTGRYVIFNVPAGSYTVQGYAAGVQLDPVETTLEAGEAKMNLGLTESDRPLSIVSGNVQIVNASGDSLTSVVLSVESTFVEATGRGTVPLGLRVSEVTGAFSIDDVPDGRYVVLAAFENDGLVLDPDETIGGTQIIRIQVPDPVTGNTMNLPEGFKVTGALAVVFPGSDGPEQLLTATPTFEWEDDSSEDGYQIRVIDAFGNETWNEEVGPVTGSSTVTYAYAGPDLQPGMFYQFRTRSFRDKSGVRTSISSTEDLKGVFFYLAP